MAFSFCWSYEEKHVCMLPEEPKYFDLPPTAGCHRILLRKIRHLMLPCGWHHGSLFFIRSQRRLKKERDRQVALGHWHIWHPYSPICFYWGCLVASLMFVLLLYMPLQVFYQCPSRYDPFILFCDGVAFLDIFSKFITGQEHGDDNMITLNPKAIAKRYLSGMFIFDFVAALPLQCVDLMGHCTHPTYTGWYVLKLFRLISLQKVWHSLHKQMGLSFVAASTITVVFRCLLFFHWLTYLHYQVPLFYIDIVDTDNDRAAQNWFQRLLVKSAATTTVFQKYIANLYFVCGLCNGAVNHTHVLDVVDPELLMNIFLGLVGLIFSTYTFTTLLRLAVYARFDVILYNGRVKELHEYMMFKALPKTLQHKIQLFLNYKFYDHYFNEEAIMNTINEQIRQDINMHCCKKLVLNVPLFQDMPIALINTLVFALTRMLYMPGEVVVKCDQPGQSIYLISSGTVAVINCTGREVAHLRDGSFFGESALLNPGMRRSATIVALEITEIFKLSTKDFMSCLQPYPHMKRRLDDAAARKRIARPHRQTRP